MSIVMSFLNIMYLGEFLESSDVLHKLKLPEGMVNVMADAT